MGASLAIPDESNPLAGPAIRVHEAPPSPSICNRVLLLEDDADFRDVVRDYLVEAGYAVVTAQNGVEGIHEVISAEFAIIICDMMMPKLPGDMFYRAVERVRPEHCERFIFMTGYRGNDKANEFIRSVEGKVLNKPFPMDELLDVIHLMEIRRQLLELAPECVPPAEPEPETVIHHSFDEPPAAPEPPVAPPPEIKTIAPRLFVAPAAPATPSPQNVPVAPATRKTVAVSGWSKGWLLPPAAVFLFIAAGAVVMSRAKAINDSLGQAEATLELKRQAWVTTSTELEEAKRAHEQLESLLARPAKLKAERDKASWTPLLRRIMSKAGPEIGFRTVRARANEVHPDACEFHLEGFAAGPAPRLPAENFRRTVETALGISSEELGTVRFKRLEDEPPMRAGGSELQRVGFTISAVVNKMSKAQGTSENQ